MPDMKTWRENRYKLFNEKIDSFREHPRYEWLRENANYAMRANEGYGYSMIAGADFIERIEKCLWIISKIGLMARTNLNGNPNGNKQLFLWRLRE